MLSFNSSLLNSSCRPNELHDEHAKETLCAQLPVQWVQEEQEEQRGDQQSVRTKVRNNAEAVWKQFAIKKAIP